MDIASIARPEIVAMKAYESARGGAPADGILLNANEAPCTLVDDPLWQRLQLNRYPQPQPAELRARLARLYGVEELQTLVTRGSDEGIDLLTRVFCRAGRDAVIECPPCFGMYRIAAAIQGARVIGVPRRAAQGFAIDFAELERQLDASDPVRLVFLTSPNNPTGDLVGRPALESLLEKCRERSLVVLDEAYIEFCEAASAADLITRWPNLVVLRTLSKAWAAAGLRCGAVLADEQVIGLLQRVMAPYPLPATTVAAALQATSAAAHDAQRRMLAQVRAEKAALVDFLRGCDWVTELWEGQANFVLVRLADAAVLTDWCAARGIRIRDFSGSPGLDGCVRLSIGSQAEMSALTAALRDFGEAS